MENHWEAFNSQLPFSALTSVVLSDTCFTLLVIATAAFGVRVTCCVGPSIKGALTRPALEINMNQHGFPQTHAPKFLGHVLLRVLSRRQHITHAQTHAYQGRKGMREPS